MSWYIAAAVNQSYPYGRDFPTTYNTSWYASGDVQLPYKLFRIIKNVNNSYVSNALIPPPEMQTYFKSVFGGVQIPHSIYRTEFNTNDYYPFKWWWFQKDTETDEGTIETEHSPMEIGGYRNNYPTFTNNNNKGIENQFGKNPFNDEFNPNSIGAKSCASGIAPRAWIITPQAYAEITNMMTTESFLDAVSAKFTKWISGIDPTNAVQRIITFPCSLNDLTSDNPDLRSQVTAYGVVDVPLTTLSYSTPIRTVLQLDFGEVTLNVKQAWEVENIQYSIYLPFAGIYQLEIRNAATIKLVGLLDLLGCMIQYVVIADGEPVFVAKGSCGVDITPSNMSAVNGQNFIASIPSFVAAGTVLVGGALGSISASLGSAAFSLGSESLLNAGIAAESASKGLSTASATAQKVHLPTIGYNSPTIGGSADTMMPPYPRIIAKIQRMHEDAIGYGEILGYEDQVARKIKDCSGYIKCNNFKCPIIQATKEEKDLICNLMNNGVFV